MIPLFKRLLGRVETRLESSNQGLLGVPKRLRLKTYAAETGYVYQYVFRGYKDKLSEGDRAFSFELHHQSQVNPGSITVNEAGWKRCELELGRALLAQERYGIAKMALFEAFDTLPTLPLQISVSPSDMLRLLGKLGRN